MNRFEEQLHTIGQTVYLSSNEQVLMREKLVRYMEMKPIRVTTQKTMRFWNAWFDNKTLASFTRSRLVPASLVALLVISMSAGVSYAAESALPGDTLYSVKVGVNEPVVSAMMFSEQARIAWLSQLAERRLQEASILTAQGRLDTAKGQEVALRFAEHATALKEQTQELEKSNPAAAAQASADAATTLEAHEAILARLAVDKDDPTPQTTDLVGQVRVAAKAFARLSEDAQTKAFQLSTSTDNDATSTTSIQKGATLKESLVINMRTTARANIDQAYVLLGKINDQQSDSAANTKNRIDAIETSFTQGDDLLAQGKYGDAYRAFKEAAANALTITRLLDAEVLFQIEIAPSSDGVATSTENVSSETSLQQAQIAKMRTRAQGTIAQAQQGVLKINTDGAEGLRATNVLKDAKAFLLRGDIAVATKDNDDAAYLFRQALAMAQRALDLLSSTPEKESDNTSRDTDDTGSVTSSPALPDVSSLPPLDVVQVHHAYVNGTHTYSGVFVTPTACFTLEAQATTSAADKMMLILTTHETNPQCPQQQLDEKPFSASISAVEQVSLDSVRLNGMPSKFVLIEDSATSTDQ